MMATTDVALPVGTILAYAGQVTDNNDLLQVGWSLCNGEALQVSQYPDLFQAIGTANGGDGISTLNLPDLRGRFPRGLDTSGNVDRYAASRIAPAAGGSSGAVVGTVEPFYTANASDGFQASVPNVPTTSHNAYGTDNATMLLDGGEQTFASQNGGDGETRPVNAYVNFIIKIASGAEALVGSVVPYAGDLPRCPTLQSLYLLCNGALEDCASYVELYKAIGTACGSTGASNFNLPNYCGLFLRGVDDGASRDPQAASRMPMAPGGVGGDQAGSCQSWTTGLPVNPFTITFKLGNEPFVSDHCLGFENSAWNPGSVNADVTASGGDAETRPVNVYVDFYALQQTPPAGTDAIPVGGVIAFAGPGDGPNCPDATQWMLCNGASLASVDYPELYAAIASDNGGDTQTFNVPDYQGYFLRGRDGTAQFDPDVETRTAAAPGGQTGNHVGSQQGFATGKPQQPIQAPVAHLPQTNAHTAKALAHHEVANWGQILTVKVSGGDLETCPVNIAVNFYIKCAASAS
ncbi:phage tail protein [Cupriavidus sp. CP313]